MNTPSPPLCDFAPANDVPLILGPTTTVNGAIELPGELVIQGLLEGQVKAYKVTVGPNGTVSGTLIAAEVVIEGEAEDILILADKIVLRNGSYVTGEIWHKELVLEAGHLFEGKSRRHADPRALASSMIEISVTSEPIDEGGNNK
jgi:cytoskeletal protein CcmA (bactofilin family)